ncbi:MAG: DUF86 domain-containing protein [Candidatus Dormibacteraeota bacterium]|nr:DUF86 domain-containing protein [Candidatus Dormibacteraeota bacterium]
MTPIATDEERRYLTYILESIDRIRDYLPRSEREFLRNSIAQDAVMWRLQTMADAAKAHLGDELKARHPEVPWRAVYGFRNVAAHEYAQTNLVLVWDIVSNHLQPLRNAVIAELGAGNSRA